jgi:sterol desaturase/sphingolipid hydroxylase (fatty acid hydroxylase superfamily)
MSIAVVSTSGLSQQAIAAVGSALAGSDWLGLGLVWATVGFAAVLTYARSNVGRTGLRGFLRHALPEGTLRHRSARADFLFWLSRRLFMPLFVLPLGLSTVTAGYGAYKILSVIAGPANHTTDAGPVTLWAFTLSMIVAYDLSYYIYHYLCHHVTVLWELHKVHHSAEVMVGVTKDRVHPLDEILNRWWNGLIPGLTYGVWLFFALNPVEVTVFGLDAYFIRGLLMMDVVRHTHMKLSYGKWLNKILLCPHYHQLHHSVDPAHYNSNYGLLFSVWDRMFGTLVVPTPDESFTFGLANHEHDAYQSLLRLHIVPVRRIAALARHWFDKRYGRAVAPSEPASAAEQHAAWHH